MKAAVLIAVLSSVVSDCDGDVAYWREFNRKFCLLEQVCENGGVPTWDDSVNHCYCVLPGRSVKP